MSDVQLLPGGRQLDLQRVVLLAQVIDLVRQLVSPSEKHLERNWPAPGRRSRPRGARGRAGKHQPGGRRDSHRGYKAACGQGKPCLSAWPDLAPGVPTYRRALHVRGSFPKPAPPRAGESQREEVTAGTLSDRTPLCTADLKSSHWPTGELRCLIGQKVPPGHRYAV